MALKDAIGRISAEKKIPTGLSYPALYYGELIRPCITKVLDPNTMIDVVDE